MKKFLCPVAFAHGIVRVTLCRCPKFPRWTTVPAAARQAAAGIDPEKIRAHVRFLASDLLEGRGPGKRGGQLAAEYIATQFALAGAKPAGENGTYFQAVPLMAVHTDADKTSFTFVPASGAPIQLELWRRLCDQGPNRRAECRPGRADRLRGLWDQCARVSME